jgi:hypothetical protein
MNSMNNPGSAGPESAGMQLPPPIAEQAGSQNVPQNDAEKHSERGSAATAEHASVVQSQGMPMPSIPMPVPAAGQQTAQQGAVSNTTNAATPTTADDNDLLEKEWVNKAKQIVERTRDDPYRQSEQLTGVKVDYMQKRYGKTIKLGK